MKEDALNFFMDLLNDWGIVPKSSWILNDNTSVPNFHLIQGQRRLSIYIPEKDYSGYFLAKSAHIVISVRYIEHVYVIRTFCERVLPLPDNLDWFNNPEFHEAYRRMTILFFKEVERYFDLNQYRNDETSYLYF